MRVPARRAAQRPIQARPPGPAFGRGGRAEVEPPPGDPARGVLLGALLSSLFWLALAWML